MNTFGHGPLDGATHRRQSTGRMTLRPHEHRQVMDRDDSGAIETREVKARTVKQIRRVTTQYESLRGINGGSVHTDNQ